MSEKKQVFRNLTVNIFSFVLRLTVGLWLTPYLVHHIGVAAYGFVPIAAILTEYIGIITSSLNAAISRYLSIDLQKDDWSKANRTFNTAFFSNVLLFVLQIPLFGVILFHISSLFSVPSALQSDVFYLVFFSMISFAITVFSSVFSASMFAYNRLDLMRTMDILRFIVRVCVIVTFFTLDSPRLLYVGVGELLASIVISVFAFYYWKKLTPQLKIKSSSFDKTLLKSIVSMSGWLVVNHVGFLLFVKIDLILVNNFIGAEEAGRYAAVLQWNNIIRAIGSVFSFLVTPLVIAAYAKNDLARIRKILQVSMTVMGVAIGIMTAIVMVLSEQLLSVWIGNDIDKIYPLLILLLSHLSIDMCVIPINSIFTAFNRVKVPGIFCISTGIAVVLLAIVFIKFTDLGIYGVALAGLIALTFDSAVLIPVYASRIIKTSYTFLLSPIIKTISATAVVFLIGLLSRFFNIDTYIELVVYAAIIGILSIPLIWLFILNKNDRSLLISLIPDSILNRIKISKESQNK